MCLFQEQMEASTSQIQVLSFVLLLVARFKGSVFERHASRLYHVVKVN